jgi:hypothetical protein
MELLITKIWETQEVLKILFQFKIGIPDSNGVSSFYPWVLHLHAAVLRPVLLSDLSLYICLLTSLP